MATWEIQDYPNRFEIIDSDSSCEEGIMSIPKTGDDEYDGAVVAGIARLVIAAPRMLKAIDNALMYFGNVNTCEWEEVLLKLVKARAAAEGDLSYVEIMHQMDGAAAFDPLAGIDESIEQHATLKNALHRLLLANGGLDPNFMCGCDTDNPCHICQARKALGLGWAPEVDED